MMMPPPQPIRPLPGQRTFVAYGRPWKDAIIALMQPESTYKPWFYNDEMHDGDILITVIDTQPRVFGCIEFAGRGFTAEGFTLDNPSNLWRLPAVPEWMTLPPKPSQLDEALAEKLLFELGKERPGIYPYTFGIEGPSTAEAARVMMYSGGSCTHCRTAIDLTEPGSNDQIHVHLTQSNSHVGSHYSDWPATLCETCYIEMSATGFLNYLDFRFASNPSCPKCLARRSTEYVDRGYVTDVWPSDAPWHISASDYPLSPNGSWFCHNCHFVFGELPPGRRTWELI